MKVKELLKVVEENDLPVVAFFNGNMHTATEVDLCKLFYSDGKNNVYFYTRNTSIPQLNEVMSREEIIGLCKKNKGFADYNVCVIDTLDVRNQAVYSNITVNVDENSVTLYLSPGEETDTNVEEMDAANDAVNHPSHYCDGGIETIDFIRAKLTKEEFNGYCKGNALKYISRLGKKHKNWKEDRDKAVVYLNWMYDDENN